MSSDWWDNIKYWLETIILSCGLDLYAMIYIRMTEYVWAKFERYTVQDRCPKHVHLYLQQVPWLVHLVCGLLRCRLCSAGADLLLHHHLLGQKKAEKVRRIRSSWQHYQGEEEDWADRGEGHHQVIHGWVQEQPAQYGGLQHIFVNVRKCNSFLE